MGMKVAIRSKENATESVTVMTIVESGAMVIATEVNPMVMEVALPWMGSPWESAMMAIEVENRRIVRRVTGAVPGWTEIVTESSAAERVIHLMENALETAMAVMVVIARALRWLEIAAVRVGVIGIGVEEMWLMISVALGVSSEALTQGKGARVIGYEVSPIFGVQVQPEAMGAAELEVGHYLVRIT